MSIVPFELPDELKSGTSAREIILKMLARIPDFYDKTEAGFVWDMTMPTALEKAELIQFWLPLALKMMSHIWATGRWLDYHAHDAGGLERHPATCAYGDLEIVTTEAVTFPAGFIFCVPSENGSAAIDFEAVETNSIDAAGTLTIRVKAVEAGTNSNVKADSITIMKNPIRGVASITNPAAMTGGTAAESDDSLRQRIDDYYAGRGASFVGSKGDYQRWSREIAGVGFAHCIPNYFKRWLLELAVTDADGNPIKGNLQLIAGDAPNELKIVADAGTILTGELEYTGKNSLKLVITDSNGDPANNEILTAVETHIFGTGHEDLARLAPIGVAKWEVAAPTLVPVNYSLHAKLADGVTVENVKILIADALKEFYMTLVDNERYFIPLKYVEVSAVLTKVEGLDDFKHLRINGSLDNVVFAEDEYPVTGDISLTLYT